MQRGPVRLIGLDAAVDPRNNALSCGELRWSTDGVPTLCVEELVAPRDEEELHRTLLGWVAPVATVLCVDSPLGWPADLGEQLISHVAGAELFGEPNELFRRLTDRDIHRRLKKTPLDVGADRIARTAHRTLARLARVGAAAARAAAAPHGELRRTIVPEARDIAVPLTRTELVHIGVHTPTTSRPPVFLLETYPAGWFASERIDTRGYRPPAARERRSALWEKIVTVTGQARFPELRVEGGIPVEAICRRADELDGILCLLVGAEALLGRALGASDIYGDEQLPRIRREGWIWCKSPK